MARADILISARDPHTHEPVGVASWDGIKGFPEEVLFRLRPARNSRAKADRVGFQAEGTIESSISEAQQFSVKVGLSQGGKTAYLTPLLTACAHQENVK